LGDDRAPLAAAMTSAARKHVPRGADLVKCLEAQLAGLQADVDGLLQRRAEAQRHERLRAVMAKHASALLELTGALAAPGPGAAASAAPSPSCSALPACVPGGVGDGEAEAEAYIEPEKIFFQKKFPYLLEQPLDASPDVPLNWSPAEAAVAAAEPGFEASVPGLLQCACDFVQATSPIVM
jgi:hypothetical protein